MSKCLKNNWLERLKRTWQRRRATPRGERSRNALRLEPLEGRVVPAITVSGLNTSAGTVTFTGDAGANNLTLIRWETSPGSGVFVLRHNLTGGGLNSAIDLDPTTPGDQTLVLGSGSARNIVVNLGGGNDSLTIDDSWAFDHKITYDGGTGTDSLVGNNNGNAWAVTDLATRAGSLGVGSDNLSFTGVDTLTGGSGANDDTLTGEDAARTWNLDTTQSYTDGTNTITFSGMDVLQGGSGADTFHIRTDTAVTALKGGGGDDTFAFHLSGGAPVSLLGDIDGGTGTDAIDYSGYGSTAGVFAALTGLGSADGLAGTEVSISGNFDNIDSMTAGGGTDDVLTGLDAAATWTVSATPQYSSGGRTLAMSGFEHLGGGSDVDTFNVSADHTGNLAGGDGADVFNLTGGTLTGDVAGDAGDDAFNFSGGSMTGAVTGDAGDDTVTVTAPTTLSSGLSGGDDNDTFTVAAALTANVDGGNGDDTLVLTGTGTVTGGYAAGTGTDTLSFAGYATGRSVTLTALGTADGFNGTEATISGGFTDVNVLVGSGNADALTGRDAVATWEIDGTDRYLNGATELAFSAVENLTGGSAADTFDVTAAHAGNLAGGGDADAFNISAALTGSASGDAGNDTFSLSGTGSVSGTADGGADDDTFTLAGTSTAGSVVGGTGSDTLSYAGHTGAVAVFLTTSSADGFDGAASGLSGGFATIDALAGSANTDTLTGEHVDSTWTLDSTRSYSDGTQSVTFSSFENLTGGSADDTFRVMNNTAFAGTLNGGVGTNAVDYSDASNTSGISFSLTATNSGSVAGAFAFTAVANLSGGAGDDTFTFANNARVTGMLDGAGGTNTLNYSAYTAGVRVSLAANSATGTAAVVNFANVTGGSGNDILIGNASANVLSGGAGNDILTGGDGDDTLNGGAGNDILIGGNGADTLDGGSNDDILIGGVTTYDANLTALNGFMAEWGRTAVAYATRVARISGTATGGLNGSYRLTDTQVNDDAGAVDLITGGTGTDWFFSTGDTLTDRDGGTETQTTVS
jgi:acrosin